MQCSLPIPEADYNTKMGMQKRKKNPTRIRTGINETADLNLRLESGGQDLPPLLLADVVVQVGDGEVDRPALLPL